MSVVEPNVLELLNHAEDRYTLVMTASKRARQLVGESEPLLQDPTGKKKPLQMAIDEINAGLLSSERPAEPVEAEEE